MPSLEDLIRDRNARRKMRTANKRPKPALVGDVLTLRILRITGKPPCSQFCRDTAVKMNGMTTDEVRADVVALAEEVHLNVTRMGWQESIRTAILKTLDKGFHAVSGNAVYERLILDSCDECDQLNK